MANDVSVAQQRFQSSHKMVCFVVDHFGDFERKIVE
jgi:hypothetical protein